MANAFRSKITQKEEPEKKKRLPSKPRPLQKSKTKAPFDNVKSRLFQSIEASRQKEQTKYVNFNEQKTMKIKGNKENDSKYDRFQSN